MVTYNYSVTSDGPTYTVQEALNKIASELTEGIEQDIIVNVGDGVYPGFAIPDNLLSSLSGGVHRLVIKSAGKFFPIIDFNRSTDANVGIDIGSNNPNVTISGFRIQFFPVGVRASLNSHYPIVKNCVVSNNRNVGILIEQCNQAQVIQNTVVNGDYGIVTRLCKSAAIVHNTVFQNGSIATQKGKSESSLWASLAMDYGGGLSDSGTLHIIGNILWNVSGRAITLFYDDIERSGAIVSNYNDIVQGDSAELISIEDRRFYRGAGSRNRRTISSLSSWKTLGFDANSISMDPKFIAPIRIRSDRNGYAIDLNLLTVSPVLGVVPSFFVNAAATATWLPSYLDTADISKDIIGQPRVQSGTAIGTNDKATNFGFYGQDIFTDPLDVNITKNCSVDPINDIINYKLDLWFPKLQKGYFYSNEREYYLYARKRCSYLSELAVIKFRLPSRVASAMDHAVSIKGEEISSYDIVSDDLYLYSTTDKILNLNEEVTIDYYSSLWSNGGFSYQNTTAIFKIKDGEIRYFLPDEYTEGSPIVITDDMTAPTDSDYTTNREYSVVLDPVEQKNEIVFANDSNKLLNSQFDYSADTLPMFWESTGAYVVPGETPYYTVAGSNYCRIDTSGYISQVVPYEQPHVFSIHSRSNSGSLTWSVRAYNHMRYDIGYVTGGDINLTSDWNRYHCVLGLTGQTISGYIPDKPYPTANVGFIYIPEETRYLDLRIESTGQPVYVDAIQYEEGQYPTLYHRKCLLDELTVEYETTGDSHYIDSKQAISPIRNYSTDGFLYIPEIPAAVYAGPYTPSITTLHEYKWPQGRIAILPWARTKGKDKLSYRPNKRFNTLPMLKPEIITPVLKSQSIDLIDVSPSEIVCRQDDINGVGFSIKATDELGNPFSLARTVCSISDPYKNFPGYLFKRTYGLKEQLQQTIYSNLDNAGILNLIWIPPAKEDGALVTVVPKPISISNNTSRLCYFRTRYPVSLTNYGNISIFDTNGTKLPTKSLEYITANYIASANNDVSQIKLEYPISYGSVNVTVDGVLYSESSTSQIETGQYFVNYEDATITVKGRVAIVNVSYLPQYVFVSQSDPYKILVYYDHVFGSLEQGDTIFVDYDYSVALTVSVEDTTVRQYVSKTFELISQNSMLSDTTAVNSMGAEI